MGDVKLDYDVVEDNSIGNMKVTPKGRNVTENNMTKTSSVDNTSVDDKAKTTNERKKGDPRSNGDLIGKKSK